jgi:glycosyltransferase involved in cell wall biosynthesis
MSDLYTAPMRDRPRVSVLVPARDEAATIGGVLDLLLALPLDLEVIVVDDGSTDGTAALLAERGDVVVITQPQRGKGAAVRAALAGAAGEICVIQDADVEYDPADLPRLVEPIALDRADVVYGSRLADGARPPFTLRQQLGNRLVTGLARVLYRTSLSDIETGHKAFRTEALRALPLTEDGFGIEAEITAWACRAGLRIEELPIAYRGRSYAEGKKITWRDGLRAVRVLVRCRISRRPPRRDPSKVGRPSRGGSVA